MAFVWCTQIRRRDSAAVSCGTSRANAVSTPTYGGYSKMHYNKSFFPQSRRAGTIKYRSLKVLFSNLLNSFTAMSVENDRQKGEVSNI